MIAYEKIILLTYSASKALFLVCKAIVQHLIVIVQEGPGALIAIRKYNKTVLC